MQTIKTIIFYMMLIISTFQCSLAFSAEEKAVEVVATSAQTVFGKAIEGLNVAGPYVSVAVQAYNIGQEIRKHNFPTIEERAHAEAVAERYAILTAENELQKCFINNRSNAERNCFGQPVACEEMAKMLHMLGGQNEVNRMTSIYNQYKM